MPAGDPPVNQPHSVRTIAATGALLVLIFVLMALVPYRIELTGRTSSVGTDPGPASTFEATWTCRFIGADSLVVMPAQAEGVLPEDPCQSDRARRRTVLLGLTLLVVAATTSIAFGVVSRPRAGRTDGPTRVAENLGLRH